MFIAINNTYEKHEAHEQNMKNMVNKPCMLLFRISEEYKYLGKHFGIRFDVSNMMLPLSILLIYISPNST